MNLLIPLACVIPVPPVLGLCPYWGWSDSYGLRGLKIERLGTSMQVALTPAPETERGRWFSGKAY